MIRIALLKKPLLSLFAYEVSCRVRVEKTTLAYFTMKASWPDTVSQTFTPKNLVPPLLGWTLLILLDPFLIYNHTTGVVVLQPCTFCFEPFPGSFALISFRFFSD